jgi:hypothetical protein
MAESSQFDINRLESKVDGLRQITDEVNNRIVNIDKSINHVTNDLKDLSDRFQKMMVEQKMTAALQQASTELVRVRQELEQNYGNYKVIRETMLGVLQATDLALVKKTTISRVSEELMLSTPNYWLAPCLVAISAWIGNDRDLAERAIFEAVKRDEERTALTMALICRRNNKIQTCYEWLSIYFAKQDAANFSEGSFTYIDAYVNGVFGPDEKHMCNDYITKWINEIRGSSSLFEKDQEAVWNEYCNKFQKGIEEQCPDLKDSVQEYGRINDYVSRINSVDTISENFTGIVNAYVDQDRLKSMIDKNLISLVSRYDEAEEPLRKEEKYLNAVKKYEGDTTAAKEAIIEAERLRQVKALNLVEQMTKVIRSEGDVSPSEKKTAVSFLSGYIKKGFNSYITEKKNDFPESITMNINGWIGTTTDGSNYNQLYADYDNYLANRCHQEVMLATTNAPRNWMVGSILLGVFALIMLIVALPLGVLLLLGAGACAFMIMKSKKDINSNILAINKKYEDMSIQGKNKIVACIDQWNNTKNIVTQFTNEPLKEIIA